MQSAMDGLSSKKSGKNKVKWFNRLGMRRQLELASLLPLILFGLMAVVVSIYSLEQVARQLILQRNKALAQVAAASVEADLNRYVVPLEDMVAVLAAYPASEDDENRLRESESFLGVFQGGVALLDRNGYAYASTSGHEERRGINYSFRDYFKTAKSSLKPTFSAVLKEQPSGKDAVVIAVPILRNGGFDGALIGVLFLDQTPWQQILNPLHTDQGGRAYLVDHNGNVIYRPQEPSSISGTIQTIPGLWAMAQTGKTSSRLMVLDDKKNPMIVSYAVIQPAGWGLIMEEPWNSIIAPAKPFQWLMVILLLTGIATYLLILSITLSKVTKPIVGLEKQADLMIMGIPPNPLKESGPQEVRSLISVFNHLLVQIQEQQAALRRYAIQILGTQEEERKRLSRELHDETVQEIVGLAQRIDLSRNEMVRDPAAARRRLDEVYDLAQRTLVDVRRMSHDLKPSVLEDLGLSAAVQVCCDELTDSLPATDVRCHIAGEEYRLSPEVELTVYRIAQEAMTNIRKHARSASRVNIYLEYSPHAVLLTVEDNGPGFDCADLGTLVIQGHLGLEGMQERAQLFGGKLYIQTKCDEGTRVMLTMPTQPPESPVSDE